MTNAQIALEAASRVHQRVGEAKSQYGTNKNSTEEAKDVLRTAETFYDWLQNKSL